MKLIIAFVLVCALFGLHASECQDSDNGKTDRFRHDCKNYYNKYPSLCGKFDDDDFSANSMCCACKGANVEGTDECNTALGVYNNPACGSSEKCVAVTNLGTSGFCD